MKEYNRIISTSIITGCAVCGTAHAALCPVTESDSLVQHSMEQVNVTAAAAKGNYASAIPLQHITAKDYKQMGVNSMADAMKRMAGVTLRDYGGMGGLKTIAVRGLGASHTNVAYDGVVLGDCQTGQTDLSRFTLNQVKGMTLCITENTDLLQSARQSSAAAVLLVQPYGADDLDALSLNLKTGSFGLLAPDMRWNKHWNKYWSTGMVADYRRADNRYPFELRNGQLVTHPKRQNSQVQAGHVETAAQWAPSKRHSVNARLYYYESNNHLPGPVDYYANESNERSNERNAFAQLVYRGILSERVSLLSQVKWNWSESKYHDENGKYPGGVLQQNYWLRDYYASTAVMWQMAQNLSAAYAADFSGANMTSNLPGYSRPYRRTLWQTATMKWTPGPLELTARVLHTSAFNGVKAEDATAARNADDVSPSVSAALNVLPDGLLRVRASYKSIFRLPTFTESYYYHLGSTNLQPERTSQWNVGVTTQSHPFSWWRNLQCSVDVYGNRVTDKIVAIPYNLFVWNMKNVGKVRGQGLDITLQSTFIPAPKHMLLLSSNYSFQRCEDVSSEASPNYKQQLEYMPKHSGAASLAYENPWVNCSIQLTAVGERHSSMAQPKVTRMKPYNEWQFSLYRSFAWHSMNWHAQVAVCNIFDAQYEVVRRYPMPGRHVLATVGVNL